MPHIPPMRTLATAVLLLLSAGCVPAFVAGESARDIAYTELGEGAYLFAVTLNADAPPERRQEALQRRAAELARRLRCERFEVHEAAADSETVRRFGEQLAQWVSEPRAYGEMTCTDG